MYSFRLRWIVVVCIIAMSGCATDITGAINTILGVPVPQVDIPFRSVEYYKNKYNINLLEMDHNMQEEIEISKQATDLVNKFAPTINGQRVVGKYNIQHFINSKKIGRNDYIVECASPKSIERQVGPEFCWASCVQYLVLNLYGTPLDQNKIVNEIKKKSNSANMAADFKDILFALGFGHIRASIDGSHQIIETIGRGQPVMMGLIDSAKINEPKAMRHAVTIVSARYSFINDKHPSLTPHVGIAFSELTILDPYDGAMSIKRATEIENRVSFVLCFDVVEH